MNERLSLEPSFGVDDYRWALGQAALNSFSMAVTWDDVLPRCYRLARLRAARETNLPLRAFPPECAYDRTQIMEADNTIDGS